MNANTGTITVTLEDNDPPTLDNPIGDQTLTVGGAPFTIDLSTVFSDPDGDPLTFGTATGDMAIATAGLSGSTLTVTPVGGGSTTITVSANDGANPDVEDTFAVTVTQAPSADDDMATTNEDTAVEIAVLDNDSDADGTLVPSSVSVTSGPTDGSATVNPSGTITYTPDEDFNGTDTFTYTVQDDDGLTSNAATVTVTITADNDGPQLDNPLADLTLNLAGAPFTVDLETVFSDIDGDDLTFGASSSNMAIATAGVAGSTLTVTPQAEGGPVTITVTAADAEEQATDAFQVTVTTVNAPPNATGDTATTDEDMAVVINVLDNDSDSDGTLVPSTVAITNSPDDGDVSVNTSTGTITYTPDDDFNGTDTFTYTVQDNDGDASNAATVTVTVTPVNDPPEVTGSVDDLSIEADDDPTQISLAGLFADPDGDALTYSITSSDPLAATAELDNGLIVVTPIGEGTTTVEVTATDPASASASLSFTASVVPALGNRAPIVANPIPDQTFMDDDPPFTTDLNDVFVDPDGDALAFVASSSNRSVATARVSGGILTVTPTGDGTATIRVTALDTQGFTATDIFEVNANDIASAIEVYVAHLSGANEVPANASQGTGEITAELSGSTLVVSGSFENLATPFDPSIGGGAHLHAGLFGQNGPVEIGLTATLATDRLRGTFEADDNTFMLTDEQLATLQARGFYVNLHTEGFPAGEIRGQVVPDLDADDDAPRFFRAVLSGRAEVPANASQAVGGAFAELRDGQLILSGAFSGLESPFDPNVGGGAHIHEAVLGANGGVIFPLTTSLDADVPASRAGAFTAAANTFMLTDEQVTALQDGRYYVNIHTEAFQGGEIRGQLLPLSQRVFEAYLAGGNEVPPVISSGRGAALAVYDMDDATLTVAGQFADLTAPFATDIGAHIHEASARENGGVVQALSVTLGDDDRSGAFPADANSYAWSGALTEALFAERLYVNVHSQDFQGGEVRGQLLPSTNVAPGAPGAPTPDATVDITGAPTTPFEVSWSAAADANGNPVVYRWQLALDSDFETVVFESEKTADTQFAVTYGAVGTLLTENGVLTGSDATVYHRVVASDGSFSTPGDASSVTLTRGELTDREETDLPTRFRLHANYPNPFNPSTTVRFDVSAPAVVRVEVLDLLGRQVLTVPARAFGAGAGHTLQIDGSRLASGTYVYRVVAVSADRTDTATGRMVLVK